MPLIFIFSAMLLFPLHAYACIGGDMVRPEFAFGAEIVFKFTLAYIFLFASQYFLMKKLMLKSGGVPENFKTVFKNSAMLLWVSVWLVGCFGVLTYNINWAALKVFVGG